MKFSLSVDSSNDSMDIYELIWILKQAADKLSYNLENINSFPLLDSNGNTVGNCQLSMDKPNDS